MDLLAKIAKVLQYGWLVGFCGISIIVGYLMPNFVFAYIKPYIYK